MRVAVVFPGQGTQAQGMGLPWRDHPAWAVVERAEKALGEPLAPLLLDAPAEVLAPTRTAQLAVLLTSLVAWEACRDRLTERVEVVGYAGHSLGQVTALVAAGVIDADDGVCFTARRGEITERTAEASAGRMVALLGATPEQAEAACAGGECWVANDNAPGQVVIAGSPAGAARATAAASSLGVRRSRPLAVSGPFHTPLMAPARARLRAALAELSLRSPAVPVVSNSDARAHLDGEGWRERLAEHVVSPVRWRESLLTLAGLGADALVEVGPGSTLAGLARRTLPDLPAVSVAIPADLDHLGNLDHLDHGEPA